jgi:serine/threonine-protein kinase
MNCPNCAFELADEAPFCMNCGAATKSGSADSVALEAAPPPEDPLLVAVREALSPYYVIEKELGRGGMAVVFKGKEKGLEREVAIKVLPPEMTLQGGTADRFRREARLAASLEHPNIIPVYRVGEEKNLIYMAMKFVRGRPLDSIVQQQGALPIPVVVRVLAAAAAGLAHAHEHDVVHRDIKGGNILIELDGRPLVSDFGIARAMTENSMTASGMVIGTPNYMSPEQCAGAKVGPQSDQYALGIVGFELLTGQLPFEADSFMGIIQHHYMTPPPDLTQVREGVPPELLAVIYKALEKKPEDRYANTHDMVEALEAVPITPEEKRESLAILRQLSQGGAVATVRTGSLPPLSLTGSISGQRQSAVAGRATSGASAQPAPGTGKRRAGLVATVIGLLVLAGGGGAFLATKNRTSAPPEAPPAPAARETVVVNVPSTAPGGRSPAAARSPAAPRTAVTPPGAQTVPAPAPVPAPPPVATGTGTLIIAVPNCGSAEISVDGARIGSGRASASVAAGRPHTVSVSAEGAAPYSTSVTVEAGEQKRLPIPSVSCGG